MKFDLSKIMTRAWQIWRGSDISFSEALHRAWLSAKAEPVNRQRIEAAKKEAGVVEEVNTWSGWRKAGYEVRHGCKTLFGCELIHGSRGDGRTYRASFFGRSQVRPISA